MKNDYEIHGDVTVIIINSPKFGRFETLVDTEDLEKIRALPYTWHIRKCVNAFYVQCKIEKKDINIAVQLHRWILDAPDHMQVDHINHDTLNNTKENLRLVTIQENAQNRKGAQSNSKSGVRGVIWDKERKKWRAGIKINRKQIVIGRFNTLEEAERAVMDARKKFMPFSKESLKGS